MAQSATAGSDPDAETKALLDTAQIDAHKNRAVLTATIPADLLQKLMSAPVGLQSAAEPKNHDQPVH